MVRRISKNFVGAGAVTTYKKLDKKIEQNGANRVSGKIRVRPLGGLRVGNLGQNLRFFAFFFGFLTITSKVFGVES